MTDYNISIEIKKKSVIKSFTYQKNTSYHDTSTITFYVLMRSLSVFVLSQEVKYQEHTRKV
jgi:hypothetical protein